MGEVDEKKIGDTLSYVITVTIPEGNTPSLVITDILPDGLAYSGSQISSSAGLSGTFAVTPTQA